MSKASLQLSIGCIVLFSVFLALSTYYRLSVDKKPLKAPDKLTLQLSSSSPTSKASSLSAKAEAPNLKVRKKPKTKLLKEFTTLVILLTVFLAFSGMAYAYEYSRKQIEFREQQQQQARLDRPKDARESSTPSFDLFGWFIVLFIAIVILSILELIYLMVKRGSALRNAIRLKVHFRDDSYDCIVINRDATFDFVYDMVSEKLEPIDEFILVTKGDNDKVERIERNKEVKLFPSGECFVAINATINGEEHDITKCRTIGDVEKVLSIDSSHLVICKVSGDSTTNFSDPSLALPRDFLQGNLTISLRKKENTKVINLYSKEVTINLNEITTVKQLEKYISENWDGPAKYGVPDILIERPNGLIIQDDTRLDSIPGTWQVGYSRIIRCKRNQNALLDLLYVNDLNIETFYMEKLDEICEEIKYKIAMTANRPKRILLYRESDLKNPIDTDQAIPDDIIKSKKLRYWSES